MGVIATLLAHEPRLARLRTAARDRYRFVPCEDWTSLTRACERGPINVVVFDLYVDGRADFERVRQLRVRVPRAALVAYVQAVKDTHPQLAADMVERYSLEERSLATPKAEVQFPFQPGGRGHGRKTGEEQREGETKTEHRLRRCTDASGLATRKGAGCGDGYGCA